MEEVKITRKLLDSYKKLKRELPVLEYELNELWMTDKGMEQRDPQWQIRIQEARDSSWF